VGEAYRIVTEHDVGLWSDFGWLGMGLSGDFRECGCEVLHYIKPGYFLTVGGIIMEDPEQDIRGGENE
jgi:hypothetical protein